MSRQIPPLRRQMTPEDHAKAKLLMVKISICNDLMYDAYTQLKSVLKPYRLSHQKLHDLYKLHTLAADFSAANSKSLGYDMAVDFGDVCDAVSAGIDELFIKKQQKEDEYRE